MKMVLRFFYTLFPPCRVFLFSLFFLFFNDSLWANPCVSVKPALTVSTVPHAREIVRESRLFQSLQKKLDHWRIAQGMPGAALSVYLPDLNAPVTLTSGANVTSATLFQAGSITKSFVAAILLTLEAQGKLNIQDRLGKYLPQYPHWRDITLHQLLNHTSGIFNYTETPLFNAIRKNNPQAGMTPEDIVHMVQNHPAYFPPGKGFKYSNTNYILAGMVISKITHQPIENVMAHYLYTVFSMLDLKNTYYLSGLYTPAFMHRVAHGHSSNGIDVATDNMAWASTAGAIVTTTQDLVTWWRGLFQGNVLPPYQLAEMMSLVCEQTSSGCTAGRPVAHFEDGAIGKGYGLGIIQTAYGSARTGSVWWHNGTTRGSKAIVLWYPKSNIYMALAVNRNVGGLLKPDTSLLRQAIDLLTPSSFSSRKHKLKTKKHITVNHNKQVYSKKYQKKHRANDK